VHFTRKMKLVLVTHQRFDSWNIPSSFSERLRREFPQVEVIHLKGYADLEAHLGDAEVVMTWSLRPEQFRLARTLRWIHSPAAAVHQLMFPELIQSDVIITNARTVHGTVVAELVIALVFALAKNLHRAAHFQRQHVWAQEAMWEETPRPREVSGATLGLVGLGSIGSEVARRASALGMRVIAVRDHPEKESSAELAQVFGSAQIDELLSQSDYVVLAAPVTPATRNLIDAARLAKMKREACLINVSRGPLINEPALVQALREHRIGGAALDVFEQEPLPADSPLWDLENLLITPHIGGLTDKLWERHYALFSENLRRFLKREPLLSEVDKQQGY
jgi:phosphoglycerate dehydrogenase-like enzyme